MIQASSPISEPAPYRSRNLIALGAGLIATLGAAVEGAAGFNFVSGPLVAGDAGIDSRGLTCLEDRCVLVWQFINSSLYASLRGSVWSISDQGKSLSRDARYPDFSVGGRLDPSSLSESDALFLDRDRFVVSFTSTGDIQNASSSSVWVQAFQFSDQVDAEEPVRADVSPADLPSLADGGGSALLAYRRVNENRPALAQVTKSLGHPLQVSRVPLPKSVGELGRMGPSLASFDGFGIFAWWSGKKVEAIGFANRDGNISLSSQPTTLNEAPGLYQLLTSCVSSSECLATSNFYGDKVLPQGVRVTHDPSDQTLTITPPFTLANESGSGLTTAAYHSGREIVALWNPMKYPGRIVPLRGSLIALEEIKVSPLEKPSLAGACFLHPKFFPLAYGRGVLIWEDCNKFMNSPVVIALVEGVISPPPPPPASSTGPSSPQKMNGWVIGGIAAGSAAGIGLCAAALILWRKRVGREEATAGPTASDRLIQEENDQ